MQTRESRWSGVKNAAARVLSAGAMSLLLRGWRKLFWWNASRMPAGRARRTVRGLLASGRPILLELGAGPRPGMEAWVSLDITPGATIQHDLTKPLPFPAQSVTSIYSSHVLEHFTYPHPLLDLLRDCRRVLKPGGTFSVAVPNARRYLEAYFSPEGFDRGTFCKYDVGLKFRSRMDVVNFIAYLGGEHKFMFDEENLLHVLDEAGFRDVRPRVFDPTLDVEERIYDSIYAQAVK
jgi:predicted SAM-dependent methyltransferase